MGGIELEISYWELEIRDMKSYNLEISIDSMTTQHLLGGLAQSYRNIPASAPISVGANIRVAIIGILRQLEEQGVDVHKPRSPFKSYARLVNYTN